MDGEIVLSFELLVLINWLMQNEKQHLSNLLKHALKNGLSEEFEKISNADNIEINEQFYTTVIGFLMFLEDNLLENLSQVKIDKNEKDNIIPILKKIDLRDINIKPIFSTSKQEKNINQKKSTDVLFQQVLKSWKPGKNDLLN